VWFGGVSEMLETSDSCAVKLRTIVSSVAQCEPTDPANHPDMMTGRKTIDRSSDRSPWVAAIARSSGGASHGPSQHRRAAAAAATVATASSVHGPGRITTMCSMPRAAISEHRRANASGDSPGCSRVLRVFSMSW
jgi:hypothetical protein